MALLQFGLVPDIFLKNGERGIDLNIWEKGSEVCMSFD